MPPAIAICFLYHPFNRPIAMHSGSTGAQLVSYGITSYFKPWYFDGKIVYWGEPERTCSAALESAGRMRESVLARSG